MPIPSPAAILPTAQHVISYHIITKAPAGVASENPPIEFEAGDVLSFRTKTVRDVQRPGVRSD